MAVTTKTAPKAAAKAEAKAEEKVLVDQKLANLYKDYSKAEKQQHSYWLQIVEYVRENEITREVLRATLISVRKVKENTANVEASMVMNAAKPEHGDLFQQAQDGEISVREFRKAIMTSRGAKEEDPKKELEKKLKIVIRYAIDKADYSDAKEFRKLAFDLFTDVKEKEYTEAPTSTRKAAADDEENQEEEKEAAEEE